MSAKFYVVCPDFRAGPYPTRERAERRLADIEREPRHCRLEHRIEEQS